jgi:hypothetical protein
MSILIVNNLEEPHGLVMGPRVLIGRRPFNTIMVPDPDVSRIHAWIGIRDGGYVLFDAGSRAGTWVNDQRVTTPHHLADGDEIHVGPARIVYHETDDLPEGVAELAPPSVPPAADPYDGGIYFDCACGGPMWVAAEWAGKMGKCRYCGTRLVVPHKSGNTARPSEPSDAVPPRPQPQSRAASPAPAPPPAPPAPPPPPQPATHAAATVVAGPAPEPEERVPEALCSICQTPIRASEERTSCPSCHLTFHTGCWQENYGCSAYGCDQVNVLAPPAPAQDETQAPHESPAFTAELPTLSQPARFPWEPVLLALSFISLALGALAFGIPSAIMLVVVLAFLLAGNSSRKGLVAVALVVTIVGAGAGYVMSMLWWKGERVWETFLK